MNPDTADMLALDAAEMIGLNSTAPAVASAASLPGTAPAVVSDAPLRGAWLARLRADAARMAALRDTWRALWTSRLLVWAAAVGVVVTTGLGPVRSAFNPPGVTGGFGWLADRLAAPFARWDAAWFLDIAHHGYRPEVSSPRAAFFPLYPLAMSAIGQLGVPLIVAGVLISVVALALALYGLHRLTALELTASRPWSGVDPRTAARLAVMVTAFCPMAFFFSAVYSESLYLALSIGVFWCARNGRWATACVLGACAAATRSAGLVLLIPLVVLYLYGPREDRAPDFPLAARLRPRYRLRPDALWLALVPVGLVAYMAYLAHAGGDALAPFHLQDVWNRHFAGPLVGMWDGAAAAFDGLRQLLSLRRHPVYFPVAGGSPFIAAQHNLVGFAFLVAAAPAVVGVLRRLPLAYGAYVIVAGAMPLSYPVTEQPLMSLPRYLLVLFPLNIWLAAQLASRPRARTPALAASALLMAVFAVQFATWHWVA